MGRRNRGQWVVLRALTLRFRHVVGIREWVVNHHIRSKLCEHLRELLAHLVLGPGSQLPFW